MHRVCTRCATCCCLAGLVLLQFAGNLQAAPVVSSLSPNAARAGDVLEVTGTRLKGTLEVLFVSGRAVRPAQFKVVADEQMEVTFPEYYRGTGSASIIVVGRDGVTFAVPDERQTIDANPDPGVPGPFLDVSKDGAVRSVPGISVVGEGAIVGNAYGSSVCFVRRNGALAEFHGSIIFQEPGAVFGDKLRSMKMPPKLIPVREITISPNIDPVLIKTPEAPRPFAKEPPVVLSVTPWMSMPGDVVELRGENLSRVSNIYFVDSIRGLQEAGFKAVSDQLVRVEVPQDVVRRQLIVVRNPAGIWVNFGESPSPLFQPLDRVYVINNGGVLTSAGGSCCCLVRNGGRLAARLGGNSVVFHETGAMIPSRAGPQDQLVGVELIDAGRIVFSPRPFPFDVVSRF